MVCRLSGARAMTHEGLLRSSARSQVVLSHGPMRGPLTGPHRGDRLPGAALVGERRELQGVQPGVLAALPDELVMRPELHDPPLDENGDPIRVPDGREAVGDDEAGPLLHQPVERTLDLALAFGVE